MEGRDWLAERFEENRAHLRGVAYRLLGSLSEADDAVQEAWLRLSRTDAHGVENLGGWLTTVTARVCLDMLRSRRSRREEPLGAEDADPVRGQPGGSDPEREALLADSVGLALLVVLETLAPAERVAFVLHDVFSVPFDELAPVVGRSPAAARQLASRARRRVRGAAATVTAAGATPPAEEIVRQRAAVEAFLMAARGGDIGALVTVLDPEVVFQADLAAARLGGPTGEVRGAGAVARLFSGRAQAARAVLIDGAVGIVVAPLGRLLLVLLPVVEDGRVVRIEAVADPERLGQMEMAVLEG